MCGITGFWQAPRSSDELRSMVSKMSDTLVHRGPDGDGHWVLPEAGLALGHRRLNIIDLSEAGQQPMVSQDERYILCFNGEIYNHQLMSKELTQQGVVFRGHSDTEVLLEAIAHWGLLPAIQKTNGMFAFALWDQHRKMLSLARDRFGEKPLYYCQQGKSFFFGSELKSLCAHPDFQQRVNPESLALYLRFGQVPQPHCIYENCHKLLPGHLMTLSAAGENITTEAYWQLSDAAQSYAKQPSDLSLEEASVELESLLTDAVQLRMISDVPLGAFLSGGIDSSMIVALMQQHSSQPIRTFSIGLKEAGYNEAEDAKKVAQHLGTDHTELYLSSQDCLSVIPKIPTLYDEPFSDSSQIPTFLVSKMAREAVTVALSGDAGDELFGGYNRYFWANRIWQWIQPVPALGRQGIATGLKTLAPETWNQLFQALGPILPGPLQQRIPGDKLHKLADLLPAKNSSHLYKQLVSTWKDPQALLGNVQEPSGLWESAPDWIQQMDYSHRMMYWDTLSYLPNDILTKVDRASMGVSLETRIPFLDHRVAEFAWSLPYACKIQGSQGKKIIRKLLYRYVPQKLIDRPKSGFGIPLDQWLRGALRDWAEDLLQPNELKDAGFQHPELVTEKWQQHLSQQRSWQHDLWAILMYQSWRKASF